MFRFKTTWGAAKSYSIFFSLALNKMARFFLLPLLADRLKLRLQKRHYAVNTLAVPIKFTSRKFPQCRYSKMQEKLSLYKSRI
jgi:hypothetical protein